MNTEAIEKGKRSGDIWILVEHREANLELETYGLISEAKRVVFEADNIKGVTALALGSNLGEMRDSLETCGADRVICISDNMLEKYNGELFSLIIRDMINNYGPSYLFISQKDENADLASRLAALMETTVATRVVDFRIDGDGHGIVTRPIQNGYLFEKRVLRAENCPVVCFMPLALNILNNAHGYRAEMIEESADITFQDLKTKVIDTIKADPRDLDIEEADIIVAGGRGCGKGDLFNVVYELARAIDGSVGGTRPVIDQQLLPFDRQIGQTGKSVSPRLLITCGISGANEFTAGIENAGKVIAINKDPNARIFKFADLGIVGNVHDLIPPLIEEIKKI